MNPADMDKPSAIYPINIGITAPPATLITITEEAFFCIIPHIIDADGKNGGIHDGHEEVRSKDAYY